MSMRVLSSILAAGLMVTPILADDQNKEGDKLQKAEQVLNQAVTAPDKGIPEELLERAECIGVFPDVKKAAFIVGGEFGRGIFTCRGKDGKMSAPAFFNIGGPSIGWQFGGQEVDFVLLIMNQEGVKHLLEDKFTLGGQAAAVAGPVGRTAQAATDAQLHAQILSWSRSRGVFLGVSLDGTVIDPSGKSNEALYGNGVSARKILVDQGVPVPQIAQSFVKAATVHARRSS